MKRSDVKRSDTPAGFGEAEALEPNPPEGDRHDIELRDLVGMGDFLAPETHRHGGVDEAASAVRDWADDDVEMIAEAEEVARAEHHDGSAEILHRARVLAAA
jgi:hypothetical protein